MVGEKGGGALQLRTHFDNQDATGSAATAEPEAAACSKASRIRGGG